MKVYQAVDGESLILVKRVRNWLHGIEMGIAYVKQMMKKEEDYLNESWSEKVDLYTQLVSVLDHQFEKQMQLLHVYQEKELMAEDKKYELTAAVEKQEKKIDLAIKDTQDYNDEVRVRLL